MINWFQDEDVNYEYAPIDDESRETLKNSIQAIKGIYSILYDTYYFQYAIKGYSFANFFNNGNGYSPREVFYNYNVVGPFSKFIILVFYKFFDFLDYPKKIILVHYSHHKHFMKLVSLKKWLQQSIKEQHKQFKSYFFQFLCEDLPQTLLQLQFVVVRLCKDPKTLILSLHINFYSDLIGFIIL